MNSSINTDVTPDNAGARPGAHHSDTTRQDEPARDTSLAEGPNAAVSDNQLNSPSTASNPSHDQFQYDTARPDTSDQHTSRHDLSEHTPTKHDTSRQNTAHRDVASKEDTAERMQPQPSENWLDIAQAEVRLHELGVSRTTRSIQRFCKKGTLQCRLVPTENGSRYIINEHSIENFVERFQELLPGTGFGSNRDDEDGMANSSTSQNEVRTSPSAVETPNASNSADREHGQQIVELKDEFITVLKSQLETANKQIAMKDEQISEMLERDHETNFLIQNLQRMIGLPEGRSTPDANGSAIDVDHRSNKYGN